MVYPLEAQTLMKRFKRQRLSTSEKLYIFDLIANRKATLRSITSDFQLSQETIRRIITKTMAQHLHQQTMKSPTRRNLIQSPWIKSMIETFVFSYSKPKTAKDVWKYIYEESGVKAPIHLVREYMKDNLRLSYKIGKPRPALLDEDKSILIKSYFAIKIAQTIQHIKVMANIDEACFSRTLLKKRSWLRKGFEDIVTNIKHSGSMSLISWIKNSGCSFNAAVSGTIDSHIFLEYLKALLNYLEAQHSTWSSHILLILDNASFHRAKIVRDYIESRGTNVAFIPAYSPEFAPVEKYFGVIKDLVRRNKSHSFLNWKTKEGINRIADWIIKISSVTIAKMWRVFFKELKVSLDSLYTHI